MLESKRGVHCSFEGTATCMCIWFLNLQNAYTNSFSHHCSQSSFQSISGTNIHVLVAPYPLTLSTEMFTHCGHAVCTCDGTTGLHEVARAQAAKSHRPLLRPHHVVIANAHPCMQRHRRYHRTGFPCMRGKIALVYPSSSPSTPFSRLRTPAYASKRLSVSL